MVRWLGSSIKNSICTFWRLQTKPEVVIGHHLQHIVIVTDYLILPRFRDIAGFLLRRATQPLFHRNFRGVPLGLDCWCCGSYEWRPKLLITCVINFELVQPICSRYLNVTDGRTDRRADDYDSNTVLCTTCIARQKLVAVVHSQNVR